MYIYIYMYMYVTFAAPWCCETATTARLRHHLLLYSFTPEAEPSRFALFNRGNTCNPSNPSNP